MGANKKTDPKVAYYDVAARTTNSAKESVLAKKYGAKDTVNLCIREKKGMGLNLFFLLLAAFLVFLLVIEFFGVYRPYLKLEEAEAQLAADQAHLDALYDAMSDRDKVREDYRKFNYENFPAEIVNREEILAFFERSVFPYGMADNINVNRNTLTITISGVKRADVDAVQTAIREDALVDRIMAANTIYEDDLATITMTISFKDAELGGNGNG